MSVSRTQTLQLVIALVLFAGAGAIWFVFGSRDAGIVDKDFFYDLSERRLFVASRDALPPIRGLNDAEEDAVRAVVISVTGQPRDKRSHQIAYLEKYTPEWKRQVEVARATGEAPALSRAGAQWHRLVRLPDGDQWHPVASPEGEAIVSGWARPGPDGITPVICTP